MKLIKDGKFSQLIAVLNGHIFTSDLIKKIEGLQIQRSKNELTR